MNKESMEGLGMTSRRTRNRLIDRLAERDISRQVLDVMSETPRHLFVDGALSHRAYEDTALPISRRQTISQPYMVGLMTQLAVENGRPEKILEIGTGSGYQAAILSPLVDKVYTVERLGSLLRQARSRLYQLKYQNIYFRHADGNEGWPERAPFDSIVVTAAAAAVPQALLGQLKEGGSLIIPAENEEGQQSLYCYQRNGEEFAVRCLDAVRFVPLVSGQED